LSTRGRLIVFEGLDGSGKTLIASMVAERLRACGFEVVVSWEPRFDEYKALIGSLPRDSAEAPFIEALLFAADRLLHYVEIVGPALEEGKVVLLDRYYYSSMAYQGSRGVPLGWIREINRYVPRPDLAVYLDVPPEEGLRRKHGSSWRRFEEVSILERVRETYLRLVDAGELRLVDATRSPEEVVDEVMSLVEPLLGGCGGGSSE